jgi:subtilase family serine protease
VLLLASNSLPGQAGGQTRLITREISEDSLVTLAGNTRKEATAANDRGRVSDDFALEHLHLQLRRSPEQEKTVDRFIVGLNDRSSPDYHHWLTATEYGERFGLRPEDTAVLTAWLRSHGFEVHGVSPAGMAIDFSGTAGQVRRAFHSEIHNLAVNGENHIANMSDPRVPAALAPAVAGVVSLNNFRPRPMLKARSNYTENESYQAVVPGDLATIYNFGPLFTAGVSGAGQTIVLIEDSDVFSTADWSTFRKTFGLTLKYPHGSFTQTHPGPGAGGTGGACTDPGVNGDDAEATLDAQWASAAAPNATIVLASCADTYANFGGFIALENLLTNGGTAPPIVSISYGDSESDTGSAGNAYISYLYQLGATEGVSIFAAAGDYGAAVSDANYSEAAATHGINVSGLASTPYNVAVGGTDFEDSYLGENTTYWQSTNGAYYSSAASYIPEMPWNDSCAGQLLTNNLGFSTPYGSDGLCNSSIASAFGLINFVAGSGGPSACATGSPAASNVAGGSCAGYAKPSWQAGFAGIQSDGVRDVPDVSLFAANGLWGHYYVVCYSDTSRGGASCLSTPSSWTGFGGTSVSTPVMAGIQALVNQKTGSRHGNPAPTYYALAAAEYGAGGNSNCNSSLGNAIAGSCIFYDVTAGDNDVACTGSINCYAPSGTYGVLSTSNSAYQPAYATTTGWDFATGIGTVNAYNLVMNWPSGP